MTPEDGSSSRSSRRNSVDLPAPLGPTMTVQTPDRMARSTFNSGCAWVAPLPRVTVTPTSSNSSDTRRSCHPRQSRARSDPPHPSVGLREQQGFRRLHGVQCPRACDTVNRETRRLLEVTYGRVGLLTEVTVDRQLVTEQVEVLLQPLDVASVHRGVLLGHRTRRAQRVMYDDHVRRRRCS